MPDRPGDILPKVMPEDDQFIHLCYAYLDGLLSDEAARKFAEMLVGDDRRQDLFIYLCLHDQAVASLKRPERQTMADMDDSCFDEETFVTLQALASPEAQHDPAQLVDITEQVERQTRPTSTVTTEPAARPAPRDDQDGPLFNFAGVRLYRNETGHGLTVRKLAYAAVFILVATVSAVLYYQHVNRPIDSTPIDQPPVARVVATVTEVLDARWDRDQQAIATGTVLHAGDRFRMLKGVMQLTTKPGALVTLEAPCDVEMVDDDQMRLDSGKLVVRVPTGRSQEFFVDTPKAKVVDYGTEFGVQVRQAGDTDVAVFEGRVQLREATSEQSRSPRTLLLAKGLGGRVDADGHLDPRPKRIENMATAFVREVPRSQYENAIVAAEPLAYWTFDQVRGRLSENAFGRFVYTGNRSGDLTGASGPAGLKDDNQALWFPDQNPGHMEIPYSKALELTSDFTIAAWVNPSANISTLSRIISNRARTGGYGVGITGPDNAWGQPPWCLLVTSFEMNDYTASDIELTPGRWHHVAVTVSKQGEVSVYVNGQPTRAVWAAGAGGGPAPFYPSPAPVRIGCNPFVAAGYSPESWQGGIDELVIFDRVLSAEQIATLFVKQPAPATPANQPAID